MSGTTTAPKTHMQLKRTERGEHWARMYNTQDLRRTFQSTARHLLGDVNPEWRLLGAKTVRAMLGKLVVIADASQILFCLVDLSLDEAQAWVEALSHQLPEHSFEVFLEEKEGTYQVLCTTLPE